jgi:hypothetical protein
MRRRSFLTALGAAAVAACTRAEPATTTIAATRGPASPPTGDAALIGRAVVRERAAVAAYAVAAASPLLTAPVKARVEAFRAHHEAHVAAFTRALELAGHRRPDDLPVGPPPATESEIVTIEALAGVETALMTFHLDNVGRAATGELAMTVTSVLGVEARHAAVLRALAGGDAITSPFVAP